MQRDYLDPEVATKPVSGEEVHRVLTATGKMLDLLRASDIPVIHVYTTRRLEEVRRGLDANPYGRALRLAAMTTGLVERGQPDRIEGSPQSQIPPELLDDRDLHIASKKSMDGFLGTELDLILRRAFEADTLIIAGINTDTCVYSTTFTAANLGYRPIVVSDCVASRRGTERHQMALELMADSIAWVMSLEEVRSKVSAT